MHRAGVVRLVPLAAVALALPLSGVRAEPMPRPAVDYVAEGTMTSSKGSGPATMRHGAGKMRLDAEVEGNPSSIFIDLVAHKATVVTQRMGQKIALEVDPDRVGEAVYGLQRDARRVGEDKVAGEACAEYEFESGRGRTLRTCVTADGIAVRSRDVSRKRVVWEASRVTRGAQNAALFVVPTDATPLHIPRPR